MSHFFGWRYNLDWEYHPDVHDFVIKNVKKYKITMTFQPKLYFKLK